MRLTSRLHLNQGNYPFRRGQRSQWSAPACHFCANADPPTRPPKAALVILNFHNVDIDKDQLRDYKAIKRSDCSGVRACSKIAAMPRTGNTVAVVGGRGARSRIRFLVRSGMERDADELFKTAETVLAGVLPPT
jgi:hypothetical protein